MEVDAAIQDERVVDLISTQARTLDKLIDGKNEGEEKHSWLAPFTETNAIFVCFDAAVAISRLTLWNYANTCVEINQCVRCTRQFFT